MKPFNEQMEEFDARRRAAFISDVDMAREAGIDPSSLSQYRNGHREPSMKRWMSLNEVLDRMIGQRAEELRKLAQ